MDKTLFGHIDMVVIDGDGDLHLFNYKVTTTSIQPSSVKLEKYKYQMALLK
nr:MAG TPA: UvrD/REP helicase [Bacteriophage sp.]